MDFIIFKSSLEMNPSTYGLKKKKKIIPWDELIHLWTS